MNKFIIFFLVICVIAMAVLFLIKKTVVSEEDFTTIVTHLDPQQYTLINPKEIIVSKKGLEAHIIPFANYRISAVVLSKKRYVDKWGSIISPVDLALGWGGVAQPDNLKHIKVSQTLRWYRYRYDRECVLTQEYISNHSSNHHIIPANKNISKAILSAKENEKIYLEGYLVNISGRYKKDNISWRSSLTRTDTGNGSCEIMYVTSVKHGSNVYR